ncbi:DNA repair protein endonuclease SAE2/CtIP C-terminus-domain-containing protein [Mycena polygramma]|nr:DNA repair protein endonuclease SAE2/CtIP C-terminus-domain-containing protein [Mycena polygramma]
MQSDATASVPARDNVAEAHKQIAHLQRRVDIAKGTVDALNGKICDLEQQGSRLAKSLGFETVYMAQAFIDIADEQTPYKELAERVEGLRKENEKLLDRIQDAQTALKAKIDSSAILQRRYDDLKAVKLRSEEKYKADYRKFNTLKAYILSPEIQDLETQLRIDYPKLTKEEKQGRRAELSALQKRKLQEVEAAENLKGENKDRMPQHGKENQKTFVPEIRKRHISISPLKSTGPPITAVPPSTMKIQPEVVTHPSLDMTIASSSRTLVDNARVSHFQPVDKQALSPLGSLPLNTGVILIPSSSDAEEDQVMLIPSSSDTEDRRIIPATDIFDDSLNITAPLHPGTSMSSETEDDSQEPYLMFKLPPNSVKMPPPTQEDRKPLIMTSTPNLKPRLGGHNLSPWQGSLLLVDQRSKSKPRHNDGGLNSTPADATDEERPLKKRRVSSPGSTSSARRISIGEPGASAATPLYVGSGDTPRSRRDRVVSASTGPRLKGTVKDKGKGKLRELLPKMETSTPVANMNARASSSKQLADYSGFKGRGRYANANDGTPGNTTINAKFAIDPAQNGGRDFQYDEVVRGREDRRHMEADDCECCREYYQAIGPMPNRLQAPLWRTPPGTPHGPKPCFQTVSARKDNADITSHKQSISRHRHHWARPKTPPSYWSIGFPNTQEVVSINEKAREMHQQKQKIVEGEANKDGGRYKKR